MSMSGLFGSPKIEKQPERKSSLLTKPRATPIEKEKPSAKSKSLLGQ